MSGLAVAKLLSEENLVCFAHVFRSHDRHCEQKAVSSQVQLLAGALVQELPHNVCHVVLGDWLTAVVEDKQGIRPVACSTEQSATVLNVPPKNVRVLLGNLEVVTRALLQVIALLQPW